MLENGEIFFCRVYHRRSLGSRLQFIDVLVSQTSDAPQIVELCVESNAAGVDAERESSEHPAAKRRKQNESLPTDAVEMVQRTAISDKKKRKFVFQPTASTKNSSNPKDIKVGDVLKVLSWKLDAKETPKFPRRAILHVSDFVICEPWAETYTQGFAFHMPEFQTLLGQVERRTGVESDDKKKKKVDFSQFSNSRWKMPLAILQCHLPLTERIADYFGGVIASNCTKDRLV